MDALFEFLNSIQPLSNALEDHLLGIIKLKSLTKKTFLLKPGQVSRNMCFIKKGLLRAYYVKGESEVSSWFMKEGDICVSIESFYGQQPGYEYIQAIEDTQFYYIYYTELEHIYHTFPEFNVIGRILTIKYLTLWSKQLYAIRMQTAKERYEWLIQFHPELLQRVPQKFIASYLDITPETLSKIRSEKEFFKSKPAI
jgi:CRP/FNR family transcriptional regulator, anaerobic regulatory protein